MTEPRQIRPECEHRMTSLETIMSNHIPHMDKRLSKIEKIMWGIMTAIASGFVGLLFFLIKGHIVFK